MTTKIEVRIGTDNVVKLNNIKYQNPLIPVPEGSIMRAVIRFGPYCADTDVPGHPIEILDGPTIKMQLGLLPNLKARQYEGKVSFYTIEGDRFGWGEILEVHVVSWETCPAA